MAAERIPVAFTLGARRLFSVDRRLEPMTFSLQEILAGAPPGAFPSRPDSGADGIRVLSAPQDMAASIVAEHPGHIAGARENFRRHYIAMEGGFDDYLARFSSKTRSTLRRKAKKFAAADGGSLDVRAYTSTSDVARFLDLALPLSEKTYQARLLDAGLPDSDTARRALLEDAAADMVRCFLLFLGGEPVAYLSLPVMGQTLVYAHLGYDPAHGALSPGTVLQMEALRMLFAEQRFRYFDFTEGEGAHKAMFGTDSVACCSFILLRPTLANRALLHARDGFDAAVAQAKTLAQGSGALSSARKLLRS
ncbi:GNAT family N-acetyltransferase [Alteriqipengyuania sp. 357]